MNENSIIALDRFIQATRDSGYKGTESAVAELVDNALQAKATEIAITISHEAASTAYAMEIAVLDNGCGMDAMCLRQALRFGGSTHFNGRDGLGRYGMGLPNSSLSQARRVTVYSWQSPEEAFTSYLDVDEIAAGEMTEVPEPRPSAPPIEKSLTETGTFVVWSQCDRLDNRRITTICRKLHAGLGRRFRNFIWAGVQITVNGEQVQAIDPLYLHAGCKFIGANQYGEIIEYEVSVGPDAGSSETSVVQVTFSELPVADWHRLSNQEKQMRGVSKGAGVSIVRADREVDYGWFFLADKRRENYDDWWRCEIRFDPDLDEAFGITHTKQQIRPKSYLVEALSPDIETIARALNARARKAHHLAKFAEQCVDSERQATLREHLLPPLPSVQRSRDSQLLAVLEHKDKRTEWQDRGDSDGKGQLSYQLMENPMPDTSFFNHARYDGRLLVILNPDHPFYRHVYKPLLESGAPRDRTLRTQLELLLLAAARSEAFHDDTEVIEILERHRRDWSNSLAAFLKI